MTHTWAQHLAPVPVPTLLLMQTQDGSNGGSNIWVPATQMVVLDDVPSSWLCPSTALAIVGLGGVNQQIRALSLK